MRKIVLILIIVLIYTSSSYSQWYQQVNPINRIIKHIDFVDSLHGWGQTKGDASTDTSFVIRTTNGGTNWFVQYFQRGLGLDLIDFVNDSTGYLFGYSFNTHASTMLKTTNGGVNWVETSLPFGLGFSDCQFLNNDTGFVCQYSPFGGMWKTTDGGNNWQSINSGIVGGGVKTMYFLNARNGWCGVSENYYTTTGGASWNVSFNGSSETVYKIFFSDSLHGWAGFSNMFYARTTNAGANWSYQKLVSSGSENVFTIQFINQNTGWCIANTIYKSTNGGVNWGKQTLVPPPFSIANLVIVDSSRGWAGLYHTTNGGGTFTSIKQISNLIKDYKLYQNYPNPFNPATTIKFSVLTSSIVNLIIYDISGKEVNRWINGRTLQQGEYSIKFNGSFLASGAYFYKIEVFNKTNQLQYSETKKMMLVK